MNMLKVGDEVEIKYVTIACCNYFSGDLTTCDYYSTLGQKRCIVDIVDFNGVILDNNLVYHISALELVSKLQFKYVNEF